MAGSTPKKNRVQSRAQQQGVQSRALERGRPEEGPSFEAALARLEAIVEKLDDGNLPLAQALALYKEGNALAKRCRTLLTEAEVEVKEALARDKDPG